MGRVDFGDTFLDTDEMERARGITIFSKQAVFPLGGMSVTLLDTPGHVDFSSEMERALQVMDYGILVISGADGVQGHTETLWRLLQRYGIPCFLFINKMDQDGTDRGRLLEGLQQRLDGNCIDFGGDAGQMQENLAVCEESLLESYLEQGEVKPEEIRRLIAQRKAFPCYFGSALKGDGIEEFLTGLEQWVRCPQYGPEFGAKVFKVSRDGQGNRLTHMKVTGGSLKVKEALEGKMPEKVNQIRIYSGGKFETVGEAPAGTVCAVTGPLSTYPGQGIGAEPESRLPALEPVLHYQILLPEGCDPHSVLPKLRQLEEEDPLLHIIWDDVLQEIHVQVMGEVQMDILKNQIRERFGIEAEFGAGSIVYKETILCPVEGVGHFEPLRHYAEVHLLMEPGERGSGLQLDTCCSEEQLDRNWQRLVLTHLEEKVHKGVLTGAEATDMKITLVSGRAHLKHTEGGDFRQATYRAVRQGLMEAECCLLEPYYAFFLEVPLESVGRAMADLERMQGVLEPLRTEGDKAVLTGTVPVSEIREYQREVAKYTRGRGKLSCVLDGYGPCRKEAEVVQAAGYDPEADADNPASSVFCAHGAGFVVPWDQVKDYMHVEGFLSKRHGGEDGGGKGGQRAAGRQPLPFGEEEKELEEIFTRTYGERRRRPPGGEGPRQVAYGQKPPARGQDGGRGGPQKGKGDPVARQAQNGEKEKEYLLVDGYNIIYAWEELRGLARLTIDGARYRLMDLLCNYQAFRQCELIVVFDAYKVTGNMGHVSDYHNIHVVYTKEAETADQYIEKFAHEMGQKSRVTVATSDGLEQLIIRGQGCLLMSANDLREDVERTDRQIRQERDKLQKTGRYSLFDGVDEELARYLEKVRLGEESFG